MASGDRDSLADFGRAGLRSKTIRKWIFGAAGALALYAVGEIRGWESSLERVARVSALEQRVIAIESFARDAHVEIGVLEVEVSAASDFVKSAPDVALARDIEAHRDIILTSMQSAPVSRVEAAIRRYETLVSQGRKPHDAADIVLGWSRPPGR